MRPYYVRYLVTPAMMLLDAATFTRRDRRTNARSGYWNGGPVPFGYETRPALVLDRKERRQLYAKEDEATSFG